MGSAPKENAGMDLGCCYHRLCGAKPARTGICVLLLAMMVILLSGRPLSAQDRITVSLYSEDSNVPYAFLDGDEPDGIYTRILKEAVARLPKYDLEIVNVPFRRGMDLLRNGTVMGFFPPYQRLERDWIERYSIPILRETVVAICSSDYANRRELNHFPADYAGARFANNAGYKLAGDAFFKMVDQGEIVLEEANTTASNLRFMMAGRVDCYVNERLAILDGMRELDVDRNITRLFDETAIIGQEYGFLAYGPDPENQWPWRNTFADALDTVLAKMRDSGVIDQLVSDYFA
ncbi:hypothetical protein TH19_03135 [Thalassospira profundimaris]|uniref:Uncharacterized protein n=2 Tax=Thalassospira TaxID=168934 RepID=A0A367WBL1_9PROT|nr:hypothetical protein TH19_03135 [Thalassospira profundimaris]